jgi:hypothetical protein
LGAAFVTGALLAVPPVSLAQEEIEIITEPPPQNEPPSEEPTGEPEPPPEAPPKAEPPKKKLGQLRVGGGIGFGFGTSIFRFGIAPQVSYIFKKIVEPGVSILYEYTNERLVVPNAIWNTFGSSLFVRLYPIPSLFVLVEGQLINTGFKQGGFTSGRENYGNLFLGGGYLMGVGRGAFVAIALKVNVFRNPFYPTNIPIIGVGAGFGF